MKAFPIFPFANNQSLVQRLDVAIKAPAQQLMSLIFSAERPRCRGRPKGGGVAGKGHATTLRSLLGINTTFGDGIWALVGVEPAAARVIYHVKTLLLLLLNLRSWQMCTRQHDASEI